MVEPKYHTYGYKLFKICGYNFITLFELDTWLWLGEDQRTNIIETHVTKRYWFTSLNFLSYPHTIVNIIARSCVFRLAIIERPLPKIIPKSREAQFWYGCCWHFVVNSWMQYKLEDMINRRWGTTKMSHLRPTYLMKNEKLIRKWVLFGDFFLNWTPKFVWCVVKWRSR